MNIVTWLSEKQRVIELVLAVLVILSMILKFLQLSGADEALMLSMMSLAAFYFLSGFLPGEQNPIMMVPVKVFAIASSVCVIGLFFAFLHLPGAKEQLMIGLLSLAVSGVIMIFLIIRVPSAKLVSIIIRMVVLGGLSLNAFMGLNANQAQ